MALILNTNIASLNATRNLANTQNQQEVTFKRLSTGLRINSAKDDAAGLYLAQSQTKDIRGLAMATRNASDGISMAQTAEGALDQIGQNLQRINELAIQSANGTYNEAAREGLQKEVDELSREIFRIVDTTEFNGMKLLNQDANGTDLQISFKNEDASRINVGIPAGGLMQQQGQVIETDAQAEMFGLPKGYQLPDLMQFGKGDLAHGNALAKILGVGSQVSPEGFNQYATVDNLEYYRDVVKNIDFGDLIVDKMDGSGFAEHTHKVPVFVDDKAIEVAKNFINNGGSIDADDATKVGFKDNDGKTLEDRLLEAKIPSIVKGYDPATGTFNTTNNVSAQAAKATDLASALRAFGTSVDEHKVGTAAGAETADNGFKNLSMVEYNRIKDAYIAEKVNLDFGGTAESGVPSTTPPTPYNTINPSSSVSMFSVADGLNQSKAVNISTQSEARMAITQTREAINAVSELRATFGAVMNRFEAVISGNNIYEENLTQARSRIQDTDFAKETANLAKQQVLQQAGISSLSQANQAGQVILNLL